MVWSNVLCGCICWSNIGIFDPNNVPSASTNSANSPSPSISFSLYFSGILLFILIPNFFPNSIINGVANVEPGNSCKTINGINLAISPDWSLIKSFSSFDNSKSLSFKYCFAEDKIILISNFVSLNSLVIPSLYFFKRPVISPVLIFLPSDSITLIKVLIFFSSDLSKSILLSICLASFKFSETE